MNYNLEPKKKPEDPHHKPINDPSIPSVPIPQPGNPSQYPDRHPDEIPVVEPNEIPDPEILS